MNIIDKRGTKKRFSELEAGQAFIFNYDLYVKMNNYYDENGNAFCLSLLKTMNFLEGTLVEPVDCDIVIKDKKEND